MFSNASGVLADVGILGRFGLAHLSVCCNALPCVNPSLAYFFTLS
jgi:hypothetical protein